MISKFGGVKAISDFRAKQLLDQIRQALPEIKDISAEYVHFVKSDRPLNKSQEQTLERLLSYDLPYEGKRAGQLLLVAPRPGTISPWSTKATSIAHNAGLDVERIERTSAYYIESSKKLDKAVVASFLHDRMTETIFDDFESAKILFTDEKPRPLVTVDLLAGGMEKLKKADKELGLALSEEEIDYLYQAYKKIDRNPTDLELMMFGVVNSEHCRHKIFNAEWYINGQKQPKSLFKMIKNTYDNHSEGVISAYSDNSAILNGHKESQLVIDPKTKNYQKTTEQTHLVAKVETHNHPTAIAPFPGAATGSGGEIRDENATGRGAKAKMGLTGFTVSNLNIPDFVQPWEKTPQKPDRIASPLEIMIKGPLGGASFNNEFGRPNTAGYFRTYETRQDPNETDELWGYHKPIMIAGGVGSIKDSAIKKNTIPAGAALIVIGGPAMLIGLAGGAASSMETGTSDEQLDFASVQRGNAEMQRRAFEVINTCARMDEDNPIITVHDVGAGGLSNALTELVHDSGLGAEFELRNIDCAEPGMSPMEIWCNEAQERYVLAVEEKDLKRFKQICEAERCPYSIVGKATKEQQLVINDSLFANQPANIPMSLLFGSPPKITKNADKPSDKHHPFDASEINLDEAVERVLRIPAVASKKFLITIGDRSVGGLIARDQMVGPWQVPVSDVAVSATSFFGQTGEAMAVGERTPIATIDAPASARMAIAETITNIAAAKINKLSDIKLSANWMAASGYKAEDYNLYQTVKTVGEEFCPQLDLTIPVGKDSLSMRTVWKDKDSKKSVASPVSLIISAFAPVSDIDRTLTSQLTNEKSTLIFIDLSGGKARLGASALAQAYDQIGDEAPDIEDPKALANFFICIQKLNAEGLIRAYHDRSDGGLLTTLCEMAFAGRVGLDIDLSDLNGSTIEKLFNEEAGAVIQIADNHLFKAKKILDKHLSGSFYSIGNPDSGQNILIKDGKNVINRPRRMLESLWAETSYRIQKIRDNEKCADQEYESIKDDADPGISPKLTFKPKNIDYKTRPKVAILREEGVNGQTEMAGSFYLSGFTPVDVHMQDLIDGRHTLDDFNGLAVCGGFSYGDVLGAGQGWAKGILTHDNLKQMFQKFFKREDTFSLGVCNGCQMLSGLKEIIPGAEHWPRFLKNSSEQFEARFVSVKINQTPSIFFQGMAGSVIPIPVAHGEGRAVFADDKSKEAALRENLVAMQFVDNYQQITEAYPLNPNGSSQGITALSSKDGRALIMMPHPERAFLTYQHSWHPADWPKESPWLQMFKNARDWLK